MLPIPLSLINKILAPNFGVRTQLCQYYGKSFKISLPFFDINAQIDNDGYFIKNSHNNFDTIINIPLKNARYLIDKDKFSALQEIQITHDEALGHALIKILSDLHFNHIYGSEDDTIVIANNLLIKQFVSFIDYLKLLIKNSSQSINEYLQFENQSIVNKYELEEFYNNVDELNAKLSRLEKKIDTIFESKSL